MKIQEIEAKSMLVPSRLPDAQYVVNPYVGCEFGCLYCYASFMGRFVKEPINNWGNYVYVKTNAVSIFEKDLKHWPSEKRQASMLLSSVTDPYHGVESKYRLTRGILEILAREDYPGLVSILTKSPLVLRDTEVLHQINQIEVGMTVTTTDDQLGRFLEVRAPLTSRRLQTLKQLHEEGFHTYAFVGPLLPHFRYFPDLLENLFAKLAEVQIQSVFIEHINLKPYIKKRLLEMLQHDAPEVQEVYREASSIDHRRILEELVMKLLEKYQLKLRLNKVLYHNQDPTT
jgi:DNA repair photolyase